jgi:hypothetical protein
LNASAPFGWSHKTGFIRSWGESELRPDFLPQRLFRARTQLSGTEAVLEVDTEIILNPAVLAAEFKK